MIDTSLNKIILLSDTSKSFLESLRGQENFKYVFFKLLLLLLCLFSKYYCIYILKINIYIKISYLIKTKIYYLIIFILLFSCTFVLLHFTAFYTCPLLTNRT